METYEVSADREIMVVNQETIKDKIYVIRGQKVMLDTDLALIYGYTTKALNQQVKNNASKFDADFTFKMTKEELSDLRSKYLTANISPKSRALPNVYTETGHIHAYDSSGWG